MSHTELNLVNQLAEEFLDRLRRGERPSIAEFVKRCPEHADEIRELFPTLRVLEKANPVPEKSTAVNLHTELQLPCQLGDYRIVREVARGGMGIVYEAEQQALGRRVALKVLSASAARKPQNLVRFGREARAAGRLHHTNIVPVYGIGCEQGIHFYTMQLIEGTGLDEVIAALVRLHEPSMEPDQASQSNEVSVRASESSNRIVNALLSDGFQEPTPSGSDSNREISTTPPMRESSESSTSGSRSASVRRGSTSSPSFHRNVARIGLQIADALGHAHAQKLLHRDIKPSNILLDVHGNAWVTDFGLAKDEELDLTATGDLVGTLRYMAPERFHGTVDSRSDVFSLGLSLYELLTQHTCLPRTDRSIGLRLDAPRDLPSPRIHDSRIPADLETIVLKAIEHDPRQRYASAELMANDLRLFLADRPIMARRVTRLERAWMWIRRNRTLAGTATAAGILLIVSCLGWMATHITRTQRDNALRAETSALVHEHLARATYHCASGRPGSRHMALEEIEQAVKLDPEPQQLASLRDAAITALAMHNSRVQSWDRSAFQPKSGKGAIPNLKPYDVGAFTSDYRRAAMFSIEQKSLLVIDLATQDVVTELPVSGDSPEVRFSRGGTLLAIRGTPWSPWILYKTESGKAVMPDVLCHSFDVSLDDRWLAIATDVSTVELVDLQGEHPDRTLDARENVNWIAFSPDASRLAINFRRKQTSPVTILDCESGTTVLELDCDTTVNLQWHPDGKRLAIANGLTVELWDVELNAVQWSSSNQQQVVGYFAISPDGQWLVVNYWDGKSRLWDLNARSEVLRLDQSVVINWNADNNLLGWRWTGSAIEWIHFERSPILKTLPTSQTLNDLPAGGAFSRDGQWAITSVTDINAVHYQRKLDVIELPSRRRIGQLEADLLRSFHLSEDRRLFSVVHGSQWSRFPLQANTTQESVFGPPDSHSLPGAPVAADISADGSTCVTVLGGRLMAFQVEVNPHTETKSKLRTIVDLPLKQNDDLIRISPDGKWAATRFWHSPLVCVWDLAQAKLHRELELEVYSHFEFTPDSRRLVTSRLDAYRFWDLPELTNTLSLPRIDCALPDDIAFDETGQQAVVSLRPDAIDVVDLRTGKSRLHLHRPGLGRNYFMAFHPQSAAILTGTSTDGHFDLWDLHAANQELRKLGLGFDEGLVKAPSDSSRVERVTFVGHDAPASQEFIGSMSEDRASKVLQSLEESYRANPTFIAANDLAWSLLMAPEDLRDPPRALELAKLAVDKSNPVLPTVCNTLATAYYRNGEFAKAIEALSDNLPVARDSELPWDLYVLSLSHAGLGNEQAADHYFQMAQRWAGRKSEDALPLSPSQRQELDALRAEARAALESLRQKR